MSDNKEEGLFYCTYSDTIRQYPQNYLIAGRVQGKWHIDPDRAAKYFFVERVLNLIFHDFDAMYGPATYILDKLKSQNIPVKPHKGA